MMKDSQKAGPGIIMQPSWTVLIVSIFLFLSTIVTYSHEILEFLPDLIQSTVAKIYASILIVFVGLMLFLFKRQQPFWYGFAETLFAVVACFTTFVQIEKVFLREQYELATFVTLGSTIYLVVRGISNINDGYKKEYFWKEYFNAEDFINDLKENPSLILKLFAVFYLCIVFSSYDHLEANDTNSIVFIIFTGIAIISTEAYVLLKEIRKKREYLKKALELNDSNEQSKEIRKSDTID